MDRVEECFATSYRRLVGQLYVVCGDLSEAEDVVSEAFVRASANSRKFEKVDNPEAWLRTVAVNLARTRHRRRQLGARLLRTERALLRCGRARRSVVASVRLRSSSRATSVR